MAKLSKTESLLGEATVAQDLTDRMLELGAQNRQPVPFITKPTARVVVVDSFPGLEHDAFYQSLILHFKQTRTQGSQVVFTSQDGDKAQKIVDLAKTLVGRDDKIFVAKTKEALKLSELPTSFLVAQPYVDRAKELYGPYRNYFSLKSPSQEDLVGVYALRQLGVLMDLVSLEYWEQAAGLYNQIAKTSVDQHELETIFKNGGTLLIPFVSELIGRLVAQVYIAERAIGGSA